MLMAETDERIGYMVKSDRGSHLKGRFNRSPPYKVFLAAAEVKSEPQDRATLLAVVVFLSVGVKFHPS
jgi:hypothetical protein